jgi:exonuclease VII small subunit
VEETVEAHLHFETAEASLEDVDTSFDAADASLEAVDAHLHFETVDKLETVDTSLETVDAYLHFETVDKLETVDTSLETVEAHLHFETAEASFAAAAAALEDVDTLGAVEAHLHFETVDKLETVDTSLEAVEAHLDWPWPPVELLLVGCRVTPR